MFLNDDEKGSAARRDSGWLSNWSAAMEFLGRYPWPSLSVIYVDSSVAKLIWQELQEYIGRNGRPAREDKVSRWREACGLSGK
jgi:hypothetical protein